MAAPGYNIVATLPSVDFYQVLRGERQFLQVGPLAVLQMGGVNYAQVGTVRWRIGTDLPCLKSAANTYVFAVESQPELFYSVVCPSDAAASGLQVGLDNVLHNFTAFQDSSAAAPGAPPAFAPAAGPAGPHVPSATSRQVAEHMVKAGHLVAAGLVAAAHMAAHGIEKGAQMAVAKTQPAGHPMKPEVKAKLERAASATNTAVSTGKAVAATLATFAGVAAAAIANTPTGKKLAGSQDVQVLRGAAGQAATEVGSAWQQAAKLVVAKGAAAGQTYIHHKFGAPAGAQPAGAPPAYPAGPHPTNLQMQSAAAVVQPAPAGPPPPYQPPAPAGPPPPYQPPAYVPPAAPQQPQQPQQQQGQQGQGQFYPAIPTGPAVGTPVGPAPSATPPPQ